MLNGVIERVSRNYRVIMSGNLKDAVGNGLQNDVMGACGMHGMIDNGRRLTAMCFERNLCVCNSNFKYKCIHKCSINQSMGTSPFPPPAFTTG